MNGPSREQQAPRLLALIDELRAQAAESALTEFKANYADPAMVGRLISAIANAARIEERDSGYVVWGVRDADHAVVGTAFDPRTAKRALWEALRPYAWETGVAQPFVNDGEVLKQLDFESYFELLRLPTPSGTSGILSALEQDRLISRDVGGRWNISNLGAIVIARDLRDFGPGLARKAIRLVVYDGDGRTATVTHRDDFFPGYATGFEDFNTHVNILLPAPEDGRSPIREAQALVPPVAVRELVANALIHQDMTIRGAGPTIELFRDRLEITNPGAPLVSPERFIDYPPRSRNEQLASLMRRFGLCEELGTGVDKAIAAAEHGCLPPPEFRAEANAATRTILFGARRFAEMTLEERQRACYQHAVLRYLDGSRMRNSTLRERLGVAGRNSAQISGVIRHALKAELIRPADPARPRSGYVPFWA